MNPGTLPLSESAERRDGPCVCQYTPTTLAFVPGDALSTGEIRADLLIHCFTAFFNLFCPETLFNPVFHANLAPEIEKARKTMEHGVKHCSTRSNNVSGDENLYQDVPG
jgi:hypothetical protein